MAESGFPALSYLGLPLGSTFKVHVVQNSVNEQLVNRYAAFFFFLHCTFDLFGLILSFVMFSGYYLWVF